MEFIKSGTNRAESLDVYMIETPQHSLKGVAGHFGNHTCAQPSEGFGQQALQITSRILDFIEDPLNPFPNTVEPPVERRRNLLFLIHASARPNAVDVPIGLVLLPLFAEEAVRRTAYTVITKPLQAETLTEMIIQLRAQRVSGSIRKPGADES